MTNPTLTTKDDGEPLADGLTSAEISELKERGVDVDLELSGDGDEGAGDGGDGETDPDGDPAGSEGDDGEAADGDAEADETDTSGSDGDGDETADDGTGGVEPDGVDDPDEITPGDGKIEDGERGPADEFRDRDLEDQIVHDYDLDDIDSAREPDEREVDRWESLVKQMSEYGDNIERRKRERDERIEKKYYQKSGSELRNNVGGEIEDVKEGLRQMVSRPTPRPARAGPQIDMNNVVRHASGDPTVRDLFEESVEIETGERCVGLSTDISGSMSGDMEELRTAGGVIAEATEIIGDSFVWNAFTDVNSGGLDLRIVTGPHEDFDWKHTESVTAAYNEPTAAGIRDCRMLMEKTAKREKTMIVITDGKALVGEDGTYYGASPEPVEQARAAVREARQDGVDVIGFGIGAMDEQKMEDTFGKGNYRLTSVEDLADDILDLYENMMNVSR